MLIVYVDDMKMSGPKHCLAAHRENLGRGGINLAVPPGDNVLRATFLGCDHIRSQKELKGKLLECLTWDVTAGVKRGIAKYHAAIETVWPGYTPLIKEMAVPLKQIETRT